MTVTAAPETSTGRWSVRAQASTTPGRYRVASLTVAALIGLGAIAAGASSAQMRSAADHATTKTGPVVVASQRLVSSLAAADAAASAAFLSGRDEDPEQRRLYEQALAQATQQASEIASLAGSDATTRDEVEKVSVELTQYAGLVETARAQNRSSDTSATDSLRAAVQFASALVSGDVRQLNDVAKVNLTRDVDDRTAGYPIAVIALVVTLIVLIVGQVGLTRASRRVLNLPLALATVLVLVAVVLLVRAEVASGDSINDARHRGFDSIVLTTNLASAGFEAKAEETLALISDQTAYRSAADASGALVAPTTVTDDIVTQIRIGQARGVPGGFLGQAAQAADSPRERSAVADVAARWQRYESTIAQLRRSSGEDAKTIATGPAVADFNGFNFSIEAVLGQNRDQFLDGLSNAVDDTDRVPQVVVALLIVAALAALGGFQLRINDYR